MQAPQRTTLLHVALLALVSGLWESLFVGHGLNRLDESWPLYAAMQLQAGGSLYSDVFFVFPPGHLLPAWIAYVLDPPGYVLARAFYAAFAVGAVLATYAIGRRITTPGFAFVGALVLAAAAPRSHVYHLLFGYRYAVLSMLALLVFAWRVDRDERRIMLLAGLCAGTALVFRLTPAFAVSVAIGVGIVLVQRDWRGWLRDGLLYSAGLLAVAAPVAIWLGADVGADALWREVVTRPVAMTAAQSLPLPVLTLGPEAWALGPVGRWFAAIEFRLYPLLLAGYTVAAAVVLVRGWRGARPLSGVLFVVVVVWAVVFFTRTLGRSDEPHLDSALPPVCVLLGHVCGVAGRGLARRWPRRARIALVAPAVAMLAIWLTLWGSPAFLPLEQRGRFPIWSLGGRSRVSLPARAVSIDWVVSQIQRHTGPGDVILDLTSSPVFHVLSGRPGPGGFDIVMPATFLDEAEERRFVERLERRPPALVIWPARAFDGLRERTLGHFAPQVAHWVLARYRRGAARGRHVVMLPKPP